MLIPTIVMLISTTVMLIPTAVMLIPTAVLLIYHCHADSYRCHVDFYRCHADFYHCHAERSGGFAKRIRHEVEASHARLHQDEPGEEFSRCTFRVGLTHEPQPAEQAEGAGILILTMMNNAGCPTHSLPCFAEALSEAEGEAEGRFSTGGNSYAY
jgi:hypothetical protein